MSRSSSRQSILLANAERDGEKYAASLGAPSLKELRRLPAALLTGNAGGIVHPVIEPYVLPLSPYEAFTSGQQNDVPLLIGSNADEARAIVDVTHETAATFDSDVERSVGQLPPALLAAYPHATDEEARQAQLGLERDLRFGWDMWAWARLQAGTGKKSCLLLLVSTAAAVPGRLGVRRLGREPLRRALVCLRPPGPVALELDRGRSEAGRGDVQLLGQLRADRAIQTARAFPQWPAFTNAESKVQYLDDPITVGGVANINGLSVFDAVYTKVRGKPFAAR